MKGRPLPCVRLDQLCLARAYLDGFGTVNSVIELDVLTFRKIADALDPEREDPLVNPWKRGFNAAIRAAFGR